MTTSPLTVNSTHTHTHTHTHTRARVQLSSTKSADHKTTLLHFLANTVELRYPTVLEFVTELRNVEEAAKCEK